MAVVPAPPSADKVVIQEPNVQPLSGFADQCCTQLLSDGIGFKLEKLQEYVLTSIPDVGKQPLIEGAEGGVCRYVAVHE